MVHGIAFDGATVYLATTTELYRGSVAEDCTFEDLTLLADDLPDGGQHGLRTLGVSPGSELFLSIGSSCDACNETNPEHATLQQVASDGARTTFASGLRNTIGFDWHPSTGQLWGMDNGSDWRGNDLPPEELNLIEPNTNYGWPYCFGDQQVDPIIADPASQTKEQYCPTTAAPAFVDDAHQAPIGFTFYSAEAYPAEYVGDAFVAMRGSWNRNPPTGYKISRIDFVDGVPTAIEDFVSGFLDEAGDATFARPAGVTVDSTGSLVFSDDSNGVLYRVTLEP
jgi:glucose/arabinose dehydrogenase